MDIDHSAPAMGSRQMQIIAPPETVFAVIADIESWPAWNEGVTSAKLTGDVEPGSRFRWAANGNTLKSELVVVDAPREIGWTGKTMGIHAVHVFRFEPSDVGTLAVSEESWSGVLPRLLRGWCKTAIDKALRKALVSLRIEAERRAEATG